MDFFSAKVRYRKKYFCFFSDQFDCVINTLSDKAMLRGILNHTFSVDEALVKN